MAAGHGGRNNRADLILRREPHETLSRDSTVVRNIKKIKIFSTRNSSLIGPVVWREDLFLASTHSLPPLRQTPSDANKCFVWSCQAVEWKIVIIIAKNSWQLFIKGWEIYEKEILDCFTMTKVGKNQSSLIPSVSVSSNSLLGKEQDFPSSNTGVLWSIVEYCEVLSVLLFVSGLAGVAIYYLRYCYHASLIGPVHNYAQCSTRTQT